MTNTKPALGVFSVIGEQRPQHVADLASKGLRDGTAQSATRRAPRLYGLDTVRAFAVLLVVIYHFVPSALPGGFIGVDVFFVLSGFLITSLLVQEWRSNRRISLREFWRRRARRILPALALMLVVVVTVVGVLGGDYLVGLPAQIIGALTFSSNWVYIATGTSYESALSPALFSNLWSLAVEEQFYVLWPLFVVAGFLLTRVLSGRRSRAVLAGSALVIAGGSAGLMWLVFDEQIDPSRVYYGTDTHLFGLMLGAFLAFVLVPHRTLGWPTRFPLISRYTQIFSPRMVRASHGFVAVLAIFTLGWAAMDLEFLRPATYEGGLLIVSLATVGLIASIVCNQEISKRLENPVFAWIGKRSYSLYLWHWPVLVVVAPLTSNRAAGSDSSVVTFCTAIAVTFVCAALSYRYVELPVLRHGLRGAFKIFGMWISSLTTRAFGPKELLSDDPAAHSVERMQSVAVLVTAALAVTTVCAGSTAAFTRAPEENSIEASINLGADELAQYMAELEESEVSESEASTDDTTGQKSDVEDGLQQGSDQDTHEAPLNVETVGPANDGTGGSGATESGGEETAPSVEPNQPAEEKPRAEAEMPKGKQITVVGDSVTLAAAKQLTKSMKGAYIDAEVSRHFKEAPKILKKLEKKGKLRDFVVISLSTNSKALQKDIDAILEVTGDRKVIFVTGHADRSWIKPTNKILKKTAKEHSSVHVADWSGVISQHDDELAKDGIHPSEKGSKRYAKVVGKALKEANG